MSLKQYGVLKGTVIGHLRDADDDHYQILVKCGDQLFRIAVNVQSQATNAPSTVLFRSLSSLPESLTKALSSLKAGFKPIPSRAGGLALDYVRGGLFKTDSMKPVPPDAPGVDNDLKDRLESAVVKAMQEEGAAIYAFGERWGPEKTKADQYFGFKPGNGVHDIHMNQGNAAKWRKDDGVYQDGAVIIQYPDGWRAFFFAFQNQSFSTDDEGHATTPALAPTTSGRRTTPKGKRPKPPGKQKVRRRKPRPR